MLSKWAVFCDFYSKSAKKEVSTCYIIINSTNKTLDVKPQHTGINTYSLNQLEVDKYIYKLRWYCARDLFGSQVTTGGIEL